MAVPGRILTDCNEVTRLLRRAEAEGRNSLFEQEVYQLLVSSGCRTPLVTLLLPKGTQPTEVPLSSFPGEKVVLKIASSSIVHKTEVDGVKVVPNKVAAIYGAWQSMLEQVPKKYQSRLENQLEPVPAEYRGLSGKTLLDAIEKDIQGVMAVEFIQPDSNAAGTDLLVGIHNTREFGMVISAGLGGTDTELFAAGFRKGQAVVSALTELTDAATFLDLFKRTFSYRKLAGLARGQTRMVTDQELEGCFAAFIRLANDYSPANPDAEYVIEELEVNPFVCMDGSLLALDGLCRFGKPQESPAPRSVARIDRLLHPASLGIIGVSATKMNFGRIILKNIVASGYDKFRLLIIKPDSKEIDGIRCVESLAALDHKLDLFIVAVAADMAFELVNEVIATDAAESVMLIPGGMGETADSREPARRMMARINEAHKQMGGGPVFLGGNCLGVVSRPGHYDSWFIPGERLPRPEKKKKRSSALISQSGAFMITRISKNPWVDPAYMVAVGNQNDLTHSDMINYFTGKSDIHVIGMYAEGFNDGDGLALAAAVRAAVVRGKEVIIYKAGQSPAGITAALSHTASIAGDYAVCTSVLSQAGAVVAHSISEFSDLFYLADCLHDKVIGGNRLGVASGAGFETVAMADSIQTDGFSMSMAALQESTKDRLAEILTAKKLDAIMEIRNPFDINPGADDETHLLCAAALAGDPNVDAVVVGLDPLSPMMRALQHSARKGFAIDSADSITHTLPQLASSSRKAIIGIIDGGPLYDPMTEKMMDQGMCIFRSCERAVQALVRYTEGRFNAQRIREKYATESPC